MIKATNSRKKQWLIWDAHRHYDTYPPRAKKTSKDEGRVPNPALMVNREMRISNMLKKGKLLKEKAALLREKKRAAMAEKFLERYHKDSDFRFLYERILDFFAGSLKEDIECLKSKKARKVSLAAKWCPSLDSAFDKSMFLCESIARKVFPRELYPEYEGLEEAYYAYRVRDRLRKEVLVPLRKVLKLPEVHMSFNKWGEIQYNRVASVAMNLYKEKFLKHDEERFKKYLEDVTSGKSSIAAGALFPHEIIKSLEHAERSRLCKIAVDVRKVAELQWKRMVDGLRKRGKFKNCMAICGDMDGMASDVPVAMSLLVSEVSEEPFKGKFIRGIRCPKLYSVKGETLSEKLMPICRAGPSTFDYQTAFDVILKVAAECKLKEEDMIKRLLVFTDVEDQASGVNGWNAKAESILGTSYEKMQRMFIEEGYGNSVPEIVFWNLKNSNSTLAITGQKELALMSGFSKNLLQLFLSGDGGIDAVSVMEAAISGKEYQNLVVLD